MLSTSAPEVIYIRLHHLPISHPPKSLRVFFHKFSAYFKFHTLHPDHPRNFRFIFFTFHGMVCEGDVIFFLMLSLLCSGVYVCVRVCVRALKRCHWKLSLPLEGAGGWQRKCQGVGGHVGASLFVRIFSFRSWHTTVERGKFKLLIPGSYSDAWWWFLVPPSSAKSLDRKMDFNKFHPSKCDTFFHRPHLSSLLSSLFNRFRRIVYQEWSSSNAAQFLIIQSHRPTVSTSKAFKMNDFIVDNL